MNLIYLFSAHRHNGWKGQYSRMIRWVKKFEEISNSQLGKEKTHEYYDIMYACLQNIFFLKDWLKHDSGVSKEELNEFINNNKEIGICRDVCNGTKHYNISDASVDKEFGIITSYNPTHAALGLCKWDIIICAGGEVYKPQELINKSISLWDEFLYAKLNIKSVKK